MLQLQVSIDKDSGFCFGVVYAIEMAEAILAEQDHLYCLGDIVHNDQEVRRLQAKGLRIISHQDLPNLTGEKVLIRAHGEAPETYCLALKHQIQLIDASCPVVLKLQNRIKTSYDKQEKILIYGQHGHAEVIALQGQTQGEGLVFENLAELDGVDLPPSFSLYSQTTKSMASFYAIKETLISRGYQINAHDTICRQVSNRHADLQVFAQKFDKIIFVAGKKSSNGKVLYEVCKASNSDTYFVSTTEELSQKWFAPDQRIGICGATSTPRWLMENMKQVLDAY